MVDPQRNLTLSVVLPAFNRCQSLLATLRALESQTLELAQYEVIVLDDGSTDDTLQQCRAFKNNTKLNFSLHATPNRGPACARNAAVRLARNDIVLFLNDDTAPDTNCLKRHLELHAQHGGAEGKLIVQGHVVWKEPTSDFMRFLSPDGPMFKFDRIKDPLNVSYDYFISANVSVGKKWLDLEKYDETFAYPAYEDSDLGYRLVKTRGLRMIFARDAFVEHDHPHDIDTYLKKIFHDGQTAVLLHRKYINDPEHHILLKRYVPYMMMPFGCEIFFSASWLLGEMGFARILGIKAWWLWKISHYHVKGVMYKRRLVQTQRNINEAVAAR